MSSSSIKGNRNWRGGSTAGGSNVGFSRLERNFVFGFFGPTSPPIGQALARDPLCRFRHTHRIVNAETGALVVAEIEFSEVAVQVRLGNVVIRSDDAAL